MFYLPPTQERITEVEDAEDSDEQQPATSRLGSGRFDLHSLDVRSAEFLALPADIRHDILSELKETRKQSSWGRLHQMPRESNNFSSYQMSRLLQRRSVQDALEEAEKEMGARSMSLADLEQLMADTGSLPSGVDPGHRILADSSTRYIFLPSLPSSLPCSSTDTHSETKRRAVVEDDVSLGSDVHVLKELTSFNDYFHDSEDEDGDLLYDDQLIRENAVEDQFMSTHLKAADSVFESSGLTQKQILAVIQSQNTSASKDRVHQQFFNLPSTSKTGHPHQISKNILEPFKKEESTVSLQELHADINTVVKTSGDETDSEIERRPQEAEAKEIDLVSHESTDDEFVEVPEEGNVTLLKESSNKSSSLEVTINTHLKEFSEDIFADVFHDILPSSKGVLEDKNLSIVSSSATNIHEELPLETNLESAEIKKQEETDQQSSKSLELCDKRDNVQMDDNYDIHSADSKFNEILKIPSGTVERKNDTQYVKTDKLINTDQSNQDKAVSYPITTFTSLNPSSTEVTCVQVVNEKANSSTDTYPKFTEENEKLQCAVDKSCDQMQKSTEFAQHVSSENLKEIELSLQKERDCLQKALNKQELLAANITEQMIQEAQALLQLFGVPYIVAPMEAEAQCAFLDTVSLTDGTITDDSDIWLFGGQKVYKNFFNQKKHVMQFQDIKIHHSLNLSRQQMILLALLVGSDYTDGLSGVGPVTALEILAAFPSPNLQSTPEDLMKGLCSFRDWCQHGKIASSGRAELRTKLKNVQVTDEFPSESVVKAYLSPKVDTSLEKFTWGMPDVEAIKEFTRIKFGWSSSKSNEILQPIIKKLNIKNSQRSIDMYFKTLPKFTLPDDTLSKRVQKAVKRLGNSGNSGSDADSSPEKKKSIKPNQGKGKKKEPKGKFENCVSLEVPGSCKNTVAKKQNEREFILQREKDKLKLLNNKLNAIKVFRNSAQKQKASNKRKRTEVKEAQLSESSSSSSDE